MKKRGQVWVEAKNIFTRFLVQPNIGKPTKAQVWVETVIYTLIALTIIGLFLTFAKPKIQEIQDKSTIEQSVNMLEDINNKISTMAQSGAGNQRKFELGISNGFLKIDSLNNQLVFEIESKYIYTEPDSGGYIKIGSIFVSTKKTGSSNIVTLLSNYSNVNITYQGEEIEKTLGKSPSKYKVLISNKGEIGGKTQIDFQVN